jgi:hypothetical protein
MESRGGAGGAALASSTMKPDDHSAGMCSQWEAQKLCESSLFIPLFGSEFPVEEIFKVSPWKSPGKLVKQQAVE